MRIWAVIGIAALVPAALGTGPAAARTLTLPVCTGDGQVRVVQMPLGGQPDPGEQKPCCAKGCHSNCSRKRTAPRTTGSPA